MSGWWIGGCAPQGRLFSGGPSEGLSLAVGGGRSGREELDPSWVTRVLFRLICEEAQGGTRGPVSRTALGERGLLSCPTHVQGALSGSQREVHPPIAGPVQARLPG